VSVARNKLWWFGAMLALAWFVCRIEALQAATQIPERFSLRKAILYTVPRAGKSTITCAIFLGARPAGPAAGSIKHKKVFERIFASTISALRNKQRNASLSQKAAIRLITRRYYARRGVLDNLCAANIPISSSSAQSSSASSVSSRNSSSVNPYCNFNYTCEFNETEDLCPTDCGCNDDMLCQRARGETLMNCFFDCYNEDSDGDLMADGWEIDHFGNLAQSSLDDPDFDWQGNLQEFISGTDPWVAEANMLTNPGFEMGTDEQGVPLGWSHYGIGGTKELDSGEKYSGSKSWKWLRRFNNGGTGHSTGARSGLIAVQPGGTYMLSGFVKTESPEDRVTLRWDEFTSESSSTPSRHVYAAAERKLPSRWLALNSKPRAVLSTTRFVRVTLIFDTPSPSDRAVWWDDISLRSLEDDYLAGLPCEDGATSRCLDFSKPIPQDIEINDQELGPSESDGGVTFRRLRAGASLELAIPAFAVDERGFPLAPMLLEIRYRDTINDLEGAAAAAKRVLVQSRIDFLRDMTADPDYAYTSNERYYKIAGLGRRGDRKWKYMQYGFQHSRFQLIRAIGGKFHFKIVSPAVESPDEALPLHYISLRLISQRDYESLTDHQRRYRGFYEVALPPDRPEPPVVYPNSRLVTFSRDLMQPIYQHTRPQTVELSGVISAVSARGATATLSLGLYSVSGVRGLSFRSSDLNGPQIIPAANVSIRPVEYGEKRLREYSRNSFALLPDYLGDADQIDLAPDSARRLWIKVNIPADASPGHYNGSITLTAEGIEPMEVSMNLEVLGLELDEPEALHSVYGNPYQKVISEDFDEVLRIYREAGLSVYQYGFTACNAGQGRTYDISPIFDAAGNLAGFDSQVFEAHLARLKAAGAVGSRMILDIPYHGLVYQWVKRSPFWQPSSEIWDKLGDPEFEAAYRRLVEQLVWAAALQGVSLLFEVGDEPDTYPDRRAIAARVYPLIQSAGGQTTVTFHDSCHFPLANPAGVYGAPNPIPALAPYVNHRVSPAHEIGIGYSRTPQGSDPYFFGFYTTWTSYLRNPIYNRFLHGLLAQRTGAKAVSTYAAATWINDPYNDFDPGAFDSDEFYYPDFVLAYPTWSGRLLETMNLEGIRLGIEDQRYFATLLRLAGKGSASPGTNYLNLVLANISPDYANAYVMHPNSNDANYGFYRLILQDISVNSDMDDYQAFSRLRSQVIADLRNYL